MFIRALVQRKLFLVNVFYYLRVVGYMLHSAEHTCFHKLADVYLVEYRYRALLVSKHSNNKYVNWILISCRVVIEKYTNYSKIN